MKPVSRRDFLRAGGLMAGGAAAAAACTPGTSGLAPQSTSNAGHAAMVGDEPMPGTVGEVDHERNGFNPTDLLTDFDYGNVSTLPDGRTMREWEIVSYNKSIAVVPGIEFPAWTFNGRMPGPSLRCTEGD